MDKPKIFIGSSSEAKDIALAIQHELRDLAELEPWSQGMFRVGAVPLDILVQALDGFDFAIFVFASDDVTQMRQVTSHTVRDNVLFELGMFIGRLGSQRSFFVTPRPKDDLHLPSDLSGVIPAEYDPDDANLQRSVSSACFEIRKIIRELGPLHHTRTVLYDGSKPGAQVHLRGVEGKIYKDGKAQGEKGRGTFTVDPSGFLKVDRSNTDGKFEIQLRRQGPKKPSFQRLYSPPPRVLRISCDARAENGEHTLRFLLKDEDGNKWLVNEKRTVKPPDWTKLELFLWVDSTKDFLFRIDDHTNTAPSTLMLRNLMVTDVSV